jgi:hypothetical protein
MIQAGIMQFVAPYPSEDMLSRWSESLTRTRTYIEQCGGEAVEVR